LQDLELELTRDEEGKGLAVVAKVRESGEGSAGSDSSTWGLVQGCCSAGVLHIKGLHHAEEEGFALDFHQRLLPFLVILRFYCY